MKKTVQLTNDQDKALIWAVNLWEASMEGYEEDCDPDTRTKIRGARAAMQKVYEQLAE